MQHRLELNHNLFKPILEEYLRRLCDKYGAVFTLEGKTLRLATTSAQLPKMLANGYIAYYEEMSNYHLKRIAEEYLPVLYSMSVVRLDNGGVALILPPGAIGDTINEILLR